MDRRSLGPGQLLHVDMISGPQNDLRHVGHVGYDGVTFGDVVCIDVLQDGPGAKPLPSGKQCFCLVDFVEFRQKYHDLGRYSIALIVFDVSKF